MSKSSVLLIGKRNRVLGIIFIAILLVLLALGIKYVFGIRPQAAGGNCKWLISYGVSHNGAYPEYLGGFNTHVSGSNLRYIESLPNFPYNGVGIETWQYSTTNVMHLIMEPNKLGYQTIHDEYKPLIDLATQGIKPTKLKHNFIMVHLEKAGGFYDPGNATDKATRDAQWANVVDNFANLARVAKEVNDAGFPIDGIFMDNEGPYGAGGFWNCGGSYAPACNSTNLATYQEQSRQRGRQIMEAMAPYRYPNFNFMFMHSVHTSCTIDPNKRPSAAGLGDNNVEWANQLLGSFFVGMAEIAKNYNVPIHDGGEESYGYRSQDYFTASYNYRNTGMATQMDGSKLACYFIPQADRDPVQTWSDLFQTAFSMYNIDDIYENGVLKIAGQNVNTIQESMRLALVNSDKYVWFYLEGGTTTIDSPYGTQIGDDWTERIKAARDAVPNDPACETGVSPSPPPSASPSVPPSPSPSPSDQPDLTITNVTFSPTSPHVGDEVSFSVDIKNVGTAATPTGTGIFLGVGFKIDGSYVTWNDTNTGSLAPGATITLTPSRQDGGKTTWTATQGSHTLTTVVDNVNKIAESNENNNENTKTINIDIPGPTLNLSIQIQGRADYSTTGTHLKIYDSANALVLDKADVTTDASGNAQITLPTSMTVGATYSFYLKPKYFLADYKGNQILTNPMNLTYAAFKGGDANDDNVVNTLDFSLMNSKWLQSDLATDINKDGIVNTLDFAFLSANWLIGT